MVINFTIAHRICREECSIVRADSRFARIAFILIAFRVKYSLLTSDTDDKPIKPNVPFNTEAYDTADIFASIPIARFILRIISRFAGLIIKNPIASFLLIPNEVTAEPEKSAVKANVYAQADLSMAGQLGLYRAYSIMKQAKKP